jgi:hypothetical protein
VPTIRRKLCVPVLVVPIIRRKLWMDRIQQPEKYKENFNVWSEGPS